MKYQRLKSIDGSGMILRYFKLAEESEGTTVEAVTNAFYEINDEGYATKVDGTPSHTLIGFSHGGDKLNKGKILLEINPATVYVAIAEEGTDFTIGTEYAGSDSFPTDITLPTVGETVDGFKKVIAVYKDRYEFIVVPTL